MPAITVEDVLALPRLPALDLAVTTAATRSVSVRTTPRRAVEPFTEAKRAMLTRAADLDELLRVWKWGDRNEFRIRCVGALPAVTVWIDFLLIAEIDLATLEAPNYDPQAVQELLGPAGRNAFEVHDDDPAPGLAEERWAPDAACRWRNARIARL